MKPSQNWLTLSTVVCLLLNTAAARTRGAFSFSDFSRFDNSFQGYKEPTSQLYSLGIDSFLPYGNSLTASKLNIASVALSNSVEKPVQEPSDPPLPQLTGTAVIPLLPPPAVPVNAAASNVPSNNGAVFLGSGALGVVNLGNGAYALGSGGIGYSDNRQQPRPDGRSPLYPPLPASPNLVPAARPSQQVASVPQIDLTGITQEYRYDQSLFVPNHVPQQQYDQNGYERLDASSAGFGQPVIRYRPLKIRTNYATPTVARVTLEQAQANQLPQSGFGDPIPTLLPQTVKYV
ncbi:unnamed protein product [Ceutorhynchus assimilis]|uniref:Uncharacterized protein n=1 Tax=Ceutorhynchus assimilis TaxID=467358 RepID=A0A9P0GQB8_9CUCU|nr:unnamed protein product [Ceutorhynchus assimilis]